MRRSSARTSAEALILIPALVAAGCGLLDRVTEPSSLTIQEFSATPEVLGVGGESVMTWSVAGADLVEIDNGIGPVRSTGTIRVHPESTTTYTLVAVAGSARATASIAVRVDSAGGDPTPTPTPEATPEPTPSPTPEPTSCGTPAGAPSSCALLVTRYAALPEGQCFELNEVEVDTPCPVSDGANRVLSFTVTAATPHPFLRWRQAQGNPDALLPSEGFVAGDGVSTVLLSDAVKGPSVSIDLLDPDDRLLLSFSLRHR